MSINTLLLGVLIGLFIKIPIKNENTCYTEMSLWLYCIMWVIMKFIDKNDENDVKNDKQAQKHHKFDVF